MSNKDNNSSKNFSLDNITLKNKTTNVSPSISGVKIVNKTKLFQGKIQPLSKTPSNNTDNNFSNP